MTIELRCIRCSRELAVPHGECPTCAEEGYNAGATTRYPISGLRGAVTINDLLSGSLLLPIDGLDADAPTPLVELRRLSGTRNIRLLMKDESGGPTWSYKDRLARVIAAHAERTQSGPVLAASTGNHGAALAAACTALGIPCIVLTAADLPDERRRFIVRCGGTLVAVPTADERWGVLRDAVQRLGWYPGSNYTLPPSGGNAFGIDGYKPIAWEILAQLGTTPDWVVVPTGHGDGLYGVYKGFKEAMALDLIDRVPRMLAAVTSASLPNALRDGSDRLFPCEPGDSELLSIRGSTSAYHALVALRESGGAAWQVSARGSTEARRTLGALEGRFLELSSAAALEAVDGALGAGLVADNDRVVIVQTSTGLKDPLAESRDVIEPRTLGADYVRELGLAEALA
jgi:threonine synthase